MFTFAGETRKLAGTLEVLPQICYRFKIKNLQWNKPTILLLE